MNFLSKKALGIYVSAEAIELALVKKVEGGVELLKFASCPVPEGAIEDGKIEKPALLAKAARRLQRRKGIYAARSSLAIFTKPFLMQIMELPGQIPSNISKFVESEIKNYVVLPGREIVFDFCKVGSRRQGAEGRIFVAAGDSDKFIEIARAFTSYGFNIEIVEPGVCAVVRAFFKRKIAGRFDCNVLFFIVDESDFAACVFRGQRLDFIRTGDVSDCSARPQLLTERIASQITTIKQFYDIDVPESSENWEVTIIVRDTVRLFDGGETLLRGKTDCKELDVVTVADVQGHTDIICGQGRATVSGGAEAMGTALRIFERQKGGLDIDLLPEKIKEQGRLRKDVLISANIAAALFFIMLVVVGWLAFSVGETTGKITHTRRRDLTKKTHLFYDEKKTLQEQIELIDSRCKQMNGILGSRLEFRWFDILEVLREATPATVRITSLDYGKGDKLTMGGTALSYDGVYLFVDMLNKSKHIKSASLVETEKMEKAGDLIRYNIICSLADLKEQG